MRRRALIGALLLIGVGVVLGATVFRTDIAQATGLAQSVTVTNTAANPVPVTGTVGVQGTPSVKVVDQREPFETRLDLSLGDGDFGDGANFTVPTGKRLVVEFISARVTLPPGQTPSIFVNSLSGAVGYALPLEPQGIRATSVGTFAEFGSADQVLEFESSGGFYDVFLERQPDSASGNVSGTGSGSVYVSGYLINE
jgi:hypothetical protein